jgi:hypothetical protein
MLTIHEIRAIVGNMKYLDWKIEVKIDPMSLVGQTLTPVEGAHPGRPYLQVFGHGPDPKQGMKDAEWSSRKWWLSYNMCKNEVVRTVLKAIEGAVAHEMYENILYKNCAVFTPHMDYDVQVGMVQKMGDEFKNSRIDGMQGE